MENLDSPPPPQIKDGKMAYFCPSRGFILDLAGGVGMGYAVPLYFVQDRGLTDTRFIRTPHYYGQFALSLGKESLTFSLNSPRLIRILSMVPSVSILTAFR